MDIFGRAVIGRDGVWSTPQSIGWGSRVTCASRAFCMAVDGSGNALTYDGTSWSDPARFDDAGGLASLSCPEDDACVAVSRPAT